MELGLLVAGTDIAIYTDLSNFGIFALFIEYFIVLFTCVLSLDRSPGFGMTLAAETVGGSLLCAEACSHPLGTAEQRLSADDVGAKAALRLLAEIYKVGFSLCSFSSVL